MKLLNLTSYILQSTEVCQLNRKILEPQRVIYKIKLFMQLNGILTLLYTLMKNNLQYKIL